MNRSPTSFTRVPFEESSVRPRKENTHPQYSLVSFTFSGLYWWWGDYNVIPVLSQVSARDCWCWRPVCCIDTSGTEGGLFCGWSKITRRRDAPLQIPRQGHMSYFLFGCSACLRWGGGVCGWEGRNEVKCEVCGGLSSSSSSFSSSWRLFSLFSGFSLSLLYILSLFLTLFNSPLHVQFQFYFFPYFTSYSPRV